MRKDMGIFIKEYYYHILINSAVKRTNHKAELNREKKLQLTAASFSKTMSSLEY